MIRVVSEIRSVRAEMNVPPGAMIPLLVRDAGAGTKERFAAHAELIRRLARLSNIEVAAQDALKGGVQLVIEEATLILPLAAVIDLGQERARLAKELQKISSEIDKLERKLANPAFIAKAPEEVVAEQRERREAATAQRTKLAEALGRLAEA